MKKFLTLLLVCFMLVTVTACGGGSNGGGSDIFDGTYTQVEEMDDYEVYFDAIGEADKYEFVFEDGMEVGMSVHAENFGIYKLYNQTFNFITGKDENDKLIAVSDFTSGGIMAYSGIEVEVETDGKLYFVGDTLYQNATVKVIDTNEEAVQKTKNEGMTMELFLASTARLNHATGNIGYFIDYTESKYIDNDVKFFVDDTSEEYVKLKMTIDTIYGGEHYSAGSHKCVEHKHTVWYVFDKEYKIVAFKMDSSESNVTSTWSGVEGEEPTLEYNDKLQVTAKYLYTDVKVSGMPINFDDYTG